MTNRRASILAVVLASVLFFSMAAPAHALDKRLSLLFKTAAYGAGAGFVIGAGTMALGMGGFNNILMGTSSGMYAGILLAAYIVATPGDTAKANNRGPRNPFPARRPTRPDEYEDGDEEDYKDHLPPKPPEESRFRLLHGDQLAQARAAETGVWAPVISLQW